MREKKNHETYNQAYSYFRRGGRAILALSTYAALRATNNLAGQIRLDYSDSVVPLTKLADLNQILMRVQIEFANALSTNEKNRRAGVEEAARQMKEFDRHLDSYKRASRYPATRPCERYWKNAVFCKTSFDREQMALRE